MKFLILAALIAAASAVSYRDVLTQEFDLYKAEYGKTYEDPLEHDRRLEAFIQAKYKVAEHNLKYKNGEVTYDMEINEYADWLPEELEARNGFNKELRDRVAAGEDVVFPEYNYKVYDNDDPPASDYVNWVEKGAVTPVENQGRCGSCYAFSALGSLESMWYIKYKKLESLSKQEIVDCSGKYGNAGCSGGLPVNVFDYAMNNGVNSESIYPYEGKNGKCRFNPNKVAANCTGYVKVPMTEEALKKAVARVGPVSVCIHSLGSFDFYKSGIYYDPNCEGDFMFLNHAVVVVGYGTDPATKQDYWLVKNSWGTSWGEKGYARMARNKEYNCGIAIYAFYPEV